MPLIKCPDIRLNVVDQGQGIPLVLVHGYPLDHTMWSGQLAGLADACRLLAPDLRGFGKSDVVPGTTTMQQMADDIAALLDALQVSQPVVFCGLSMGGYVAWQFALRHPHRLAKLILCDTRAAADTPEAAAGRLSSAEKILASGAQIAADGIIPKLFAPATYEQQTQLVAETRQVILRTNQQGIAAALRGMAAREDVTSRLPQIKVPVLAICGEHDKISPPAEMREFTQQLPHGRFLEISGAGHMAPLERPAPVNQAMRDFLSAP